MNNVTEADLHAFAVGKATDEQRRRIGTQLDDPDSFANRWLDSLCAACSDPFDIDVRHILEVLDDETPELQPHTLLQRLWYFLAVSIRVNEIEVAVKKGARTGNFDDARFRITSTYDWAGRIGQRNDFWRRLVTSANESLILKRHEETKYLLTEIIGTNRSDFDDDRWHDRIFADALVILGRVHLVSKNNNQALRCWNDALVVYGHIHGVESLQYAWQVMNIARLYEADQMLTEAKDSYQRASEIVKATAGEWHHWFIESTRGVERVSALQSGKTITREMQAAKKEVSKSYGIRSSIARVAAPFALRHIRVRRERCIEKGDFDQAIRLAETGCAVAGYCEGLLPNEMRLLGSLYLLLGRQDEATQLMQSAIKLSRELKWGSGNNDRKGLAECLEGLAAIHTTMGQLDSAENLTLEARNLRDAITVELYPGYQGLWANLNTQGIIHYHKGEHKEAVACYKESAELASSALGENHVAVGAVLSNMAKAFLEAGDVENAHEHSQRGRQILLSALGAEHPALTAEYNGVVQLPITIGRRRDFISMIVAQTA